MTRHDQAMLFLNKAAEDEAVLDQILGSPKISDETVGFHCQQAAEKLLKAVLAESQVAFRRTHDLRELMDLLADDGKPVPPALSDLDRLTPYAILFRYEALPGDTALNRPAARELIRQLRQWAEKIVPR